MKIAFFDAKPYDRDWFDRHNAGYGFKLKYYDSRLNEDTATLARGTDVVCAFVNDNLTGPVLEQLAHQQVRLIAMRCSGTNNVDLAAADKLQLPVVRVPAYSPHAIAEHAMALLLTLVRKTHRAFLRTRDGNFTLQGLMGFDLYGKTMGLIGMGRIGSALASICQGMGMQVIAYDPYTRDSYTRVSLDTLLKESDVISLHCPLTRDTHHIIDAKAIEAMKPGAILLNTSRGALVDTEALMDGLQQRKLGGAGLDVYEEEEGVFFEDLSGEILPDETLARLIGFPNVILTSHQAFFTREAMDAIAQTTLDNIRSFAEGKPLQNRVTHR